MAKCAHARVQYKRIGGAPWPLIGPLTFSRKQKSKAIDNNKKTQKLLNQISALLYRSHILLGSLDIYILNVLHVQVLLLN